MMFVNVCSAEHGQLLTLYNNEAQQPNRSLALLSTPYILTTINVVYINICKPH